MNRYLVYLQAGGTEQTRAPAGGTPGPAPGGGIAEGPGAEATEPGMKRPATRAATAAAPGATTATEMTGDGSHFRDGFLQRCDALPLSLAAYVAIRAECCGEEQKIDRKSCCDYFDGHD